MEKTNDRVFNASFILLWGTCFTVFVSLYLLLATLPLYVVQLGGGETEVGLLMAFFSLTALLSRPWVGQSADRFGSRTIILLGTIVYLLSSLSYGLARTVALVLAVRLFHGFGMALYGTGGATLATELAPVRRRAEALGYYGLANSVPMAIGPALGLQVLSASSFASVFLLSAALALVAAGMAFWNRAIEPGPRKPPATKSPLISRPALPTAALLCTLTIPYGVIVSFLPVFAVERSIPNVGLYFTVYAISLIAARSGSGRIADRHGRASVILPAMILVAVGVWILGTAYSMPVLLLGGVMFGLGFGSAHPVLQALTVDRLPGEGRGAAMSTFSAAWELGMMVGGAIGGPILALADYGWLFTIAAVSPAIGVFYFVAELRKGKLASPLPVRS